MVTSVFVVTLRFLLCEFFGHSQNLGSAQYRGRWDSAATVRHYLQQALAMQALCRLQPDLSSKLTKLAQPSPPGRGEDILPKSEQRRGQTRAN